MTIIFHIDNLLLVYVDPSIITKYIKLLDRVLGSKDPLTIIRGKIYEYLGMKINFSLEVGCSITQYDFIKKIWIELHSDLQSPCRNSLAVDFLFKVNTKAELLHKEKKKEYYKTTAKYI